MSVRLNGLLTGLLLFPLWTIPVSAADIALPADKAARVDAAAGNQAS
jgi:hypothetical protein